MGVFLPLDALWTSHRLWGGRKCKFASFKSKRGACISLAHEIIFTRNFLSLRHPYNCSAMKQRVSKRRGFTCAENWKLLPLMKTFLLSFGFLWNLNCEMLRFGRWIFPCRWEEDATPSKWQISMLVQLWRKTSRKKKHGKKKIHAGRGTETSQFTPKYISALRRVRNLSRSVCHSWWKEALFSSMESRKESDNSRQQQGLRDMKILQRWLWDAVLTQILQVTSIFLEVSFLLYSFPLPSLLPSVFSNFNGDWAC